MKRRLAAAIVALTATSGVAAQAARAPASAILYVAGLSCPAHQDCAGVRAYNNRIYEIDKVGRAPHALSSAATSDSEPVWSPDRSRIVFQRLAPNGGGYNLWLMKGDGSGEKRLTSGNGVNAEPSWSPGGHQIVFRGNSPDGQTFDLFTIKADGSGSRRITSNPDTVAATDPDWSPNGKHIVFTRTNYANSSEGVYLVNPDGSGLKTLAGAGASEPAWSPNGQMIAFSRADPASGGTFQVFVMHANGTGQLKLTSGTESIAPAWSPSGEQIVFVRGRQIAVMNVDGSRIKQVTKPLNGTMRFVETPDW
jgi:TolB protein